LVTYGAAATALTVGLFGTAVLMALDPALARAADALTASNQEAVNRDDGGVRVRGWFTQLRAGLSRLQRSTGFVAHLSRSIACP
jgi:hypothetical protein